ncbi:Lipoprotein LpqB precursor [Nocardioides dokdonensis FR1436]|uniref:Lipoprotein LpqB n=1 Tax=Nocardioides dokdonensis FR1436 TaxID=1300347 RepID=A0A1A9GG19_9ACTN|nr:LpqB family beta-propeller domain-containing protein [Nocardioides dokdonensis]ANH36592.1 Lipoprotein LpqB precursor [Nocardioides dokdonensis FR1436]
MNRRRRTVRVLLPLLLPLLLLVAGCVSMPASGPVVGTGSSSAVSAESGGVPAIDARAPQEGQSAPEVVRGFLDAMQAWPRELTTAKQYLTADARAAWNPEGMVTYLEAQPPQGTSSSRVSLRLSGADRIDGRGSFEGRLSEYESILQFSLTTEDGQLRITNPPTDLVVPQSWFEARYAQLALYFLDPGGEILVPEPVFVADDEKLASTLIAGLLDGPVDNRVARSQIPDGLGLELSVPVTDEGTATIELSGEPMALTPSENAQMLSQLAWTLRQDPDIEAFTLSVGGQRIRLADGEDRIPVESGARLDPTGYQSSSLLYGLRDGLLVSGTPGSLDPVVGPLGSTDLGARSVGVDLRGERAAEVSADGTEVFSAPVRGDDEPVTTVLEGATDLAAPAYDHRGRLWLVDRTPQGAVVRWVRGERGRVLDVPGISGQRVKRFLVSRDGSRLIAVVRRARLDEVRVARLRQDPRGGVVAATQARPLSLQEPSGRIIDIAWRTTTTIAVLHRLTPTSAKVSTIGVDGSPTGLGGITTTLGGAVALAGSPEPTEVVYAVTGSGLIDLSVAVRGPQVLDEGITYVGYVG